MSEEQKPSAKTFNSSTDSVQLIYVLYLAGLLTAGFTAAIGLVWAYLERGNANEMLASHYTFLIHSFWKGFLILIGGTIITPFVPIIGFLIWAFLFVWLIARMIKGLKAVRSDQAIENPARWGL